MSGRIETKDFSATFRSRVNEAHARIGPFVRKTPVFELESDCFGIDAALYLKLENLQHSGSFKVRGAFNRILGNEIPKSGVIAASGGNHGAAVAYAAQKLGCTAEIFVPSICSPSKMERLRALHAQVTVAGEGYADALEMSRIRARETGALEIHAYDQPEVVAGQGTLGKELEEQLPRLDAVLVAVGGGGLVGGISGWLQNRVSVIAVEPKLAPTLYAARAAGGPVGVLVGGVAADALGAKRTGDLPFALAERFTSDTILVEEEDIVRARRMMWEELRLLVEPAAALPLAALLTGAFQPRRGERVCLVVCGANTSLSEL